LKKGKKFEHFARIQVMALQDANWSVGWFVSSMQKKMCPWSWPPVWIWLKRPTEVAAADWKFLGQNQSGMNERPNDGGQVDGWMVHRSFAAPAAESQHPANMSLYSAAADSLIRPTKGQFICIFGVFEWNCRVFGPFDDAKNGQKMKRSLQRFIHSAEVRWRVDS
jgi:hypothetical protein